MTATEPQARAGTGLRLNWLEKNTSDGNGMTFLVVAIFDDAIYADIQGSKKAKAIHEALTNGAHPSEVMRAKAKVNGVPLAEIESIGSRANTDRLEIVYWDEDEYEAKKVLGVSDGLKQALIACISEEMGETVTEEKGIGPLERYWGVGLVASMAALATWLAMPAQMAIELDPNRRGRGAARNRALMPIFEKFVDVVGGPVGVAVIGALLTAATLYWCKRETAFTLWMHRAGGQAAAAVAKAAVQPLSSAMSSEAVSSAAVSTAVESGEASAKPRAAASQAAVSPTAASPTTLPPAAWYPAPDGNGQQYWDGLGWTEHRAP